MGCGKAEQPLLGEEFVGPTLMVGASSPPSAATSLAQNGAQAATYSAIEVLVHLFGAAVLEIFEPASKNRVGPIDGRFERDARRPTQLGS